MKLDWTEVPSPIGSIGIASREDCLLFLEFDADPARAQEALARRLGEFAWSTRGSASIRRAVERYLRGDIGALDALEVEPGGTAFQADVWRELRRIPAGATCSYAELAARIDRPKAVRAVGMANGRNPISLVIPCHRVIRSDGDLCGYGGGIERKRWLLEHEGAIAASLPLPA